MEKSWIRSDAKLHVILMYSAFLIWIIHSRYLYIEVILNIIQDGLNDLKQ